MDLGDVIFFIVFVIIIISNIMKQVKKVKKKAPAKPEAGTEPKKKSGWKGALEQILEEARKQMEEASEKGSAKQTPGRPTGWEDIMTEKETAAPEPKSAPKKEKVYHTHLSRHKPIIRETSHMADKLQFQPECMKCNKSMKIITDMGIEKQSGLIYCDHCGAQHKYRIVEEELRLKLASQIRQSAIATERRYRSIDKENEMPVITLQDDSPPFCGRVKVIPRHLSADGLKSAVVWSEILGPPVGLKDMEI